MAGPNRSNSYLGALKAATMMGPNTKTALPAGICPRPPQEQSRGLLTREEIMELILDYLPVADLMRCAQASKRLQEMVYDDTRWVKRLQLMGCWSERQARQKTEDAMLRKMEGTTRPPGPGGSAGQTHTRNKSQGRRKASTTLFDAGWEVQTPAKPDIQVNGKKDDLAGLESGLHKVALSPTSGKGSSSLDGAPQDATLHAFEHVQSIRGTARQEYGKVHGQLHVFYADTTSAPNRLGSNVFTTFLEPTKQAKMLAQLRRFSKADIVTGSTVRQQHLEGLISKFESAALREFELGCQSSDYGGRMRQYAHVLSHLNGGAAAVVLYIQSRQWVLHKEDLGNPIDCLDGCAPGHADLGPSNNFLKRLLVCLEDEKPLLARVFPPEIDVFTPLIKYTQEHILSEYLTMLFDEAHSRNTETYLKAVAGTLEQTQNFSKSIQGPKNSAKASSTLAGLLAGEVFEPHLDLYLRDETDEFKGKALAGVDEWTKKLSDQEASAETYYMSNVTRQAAKQDFLASFKQVLMMPVNILPMPNKRASTASGSPGNSRSATPVPEDPALAARLGFKGQAPTSELAAKTAIMNSKLEGIGALFSIDVSLSLVQAAKASIERLAGVSNLSTPQGADARSQIEKIFVELLRILGFSHVKPGFDKAVDHLTNYSAREATEHSKDGVKPLVMFLELVNVGDLIQQMIDVFYVQELANTKLLDADDFLSPAVKEKKRFEQMLDERVAAGLNKGIDVLMDEVEFICATTQTTQDYNAPSAAALDIGPTATSQQVVKLVKAHTDMLVGSTDKTVLDVFNQEVGLRLFTVICKHIKRQRVSPSGAIKLIADTNLYFEYVQSLRNKELLLYFRALREMSQIFLVDGVRGKEIATIIADGDRYGGVFRAEEVYEFAERRADWYHIKAGVERAMYGAGCLVM